jgi:hypothetical protein
MFALQRSTRLVIGFIIVLLASLSRPTISLACSPALPDPWFTERISVASANLPSDVGVRIVQINRYGLAQDSIEITNGSPTPLYIIGTPWTAITTFEPVPLTLPAGVVPTHKIVSHQAVTWRPIDDTSQTQARMGWTQATSDRKDAVLLEIQHDTLQSDQADIIDLVPRNRTGDDRPANVRVPDPQQIAFPLIYGTQLLQVPITVSYLLNPTYKPDSVARSRTACTSSLPVILGVSMLAVVVCIVAGVGWISYRQKNAQHREKDTAA